MSGSNFVVIPVHGGSVIKVTFHCKVITLLHGLLWTQRRLVFDSRIRQTGDNAHVDETSAVCCFCPGFEVFGTLLESM